MTASNSDTVPKTTYANVVLVDAQGHPLGVADKVACHRGEGRLHRALTCLLLDGRARLLFARRSYGKPLWPGYWDATVATHQLPDEADEAAARRRVREELGTEATDLTRLAEFTYHARYSSDFSEREHCAVLLGRIGDKFSPDAGEIDDLAFVDPAELGAVLTTRPVAPWFLSAWEILRRGHVSELRRRGFALA